MYAKSTVPGHRYGFVEAQKLLKEPVLSALPAAAATVSAELLAGEELSVILAALQAQQGNSTYEELKCAGYNPQTRELEGVVEIKLNAGYSGGLCTAGSARQASDVRRISDL
jgi:hypothetical protein